MTQPAKKIRVDAVLERRRYAPVAGGDGSGNLLFSITNTGDPLRTSEVSMAIAFPGQADLLPLPFPLGVKTLEPDHSIDFGTIPVSLTPGSGAAVVLVRTADGSEISRALVRDVPPVRF
jgi:hypothetical protein